MKYTITFWKNYGHPNLRGRTEKLFKVTWDYDLGEWVKDPEGAYWGMYKLDTTEVRRLNRRPEDMGTIKEVHGDVEWENITGGAKDYPGVDALEAQDLTATPFAGNLTDSQIEHMGFVEEEEPGAGPKTDLGEEQ